MVTKLYVNVLSVFIYFFDVADIIIDFELRVLE